MPRGGVRPRVRVPPLTTPLIDKSISYPSSSAGGALRECNFSRAESALSVTWPSDGTERALVLNTLVLKFATPCDVSSDF